MTTLSRRSILLGTTAVLVATKLTQPLAAAQLPIYDGYGWGALSAVENGEINPLQVRFIHFRSVLMSAVKLLSCNSYIFDGRNTPVHNYQGRDMFNWLEASGSLVFTREQPDPNQPMWVRVA